MLLPTQLVLVVSFNMFVKVMDRYDSNIALYPCTLRAPKHSLESLESSTESGVPASMRKTSSNLRFHPIGLKAGIRCLPVFVAFHLDLASSHRLRIPIPSARSVRTYWPISWRRFERDAFVSTWRSTAQTGALEEKRAGHTGWPRPGVVLFLSFFHNQLTEIGHSLWPRRTLCSAYPPPVAALWPRWRALRPSLVLLSSSCQWLRLQTLCVLLLSFCPGLPVLLVHVVGPFITALSGPCPLLGHAAFSPPPCLGMFLCGYEAVIQRLKLKCYITLGFSHDSDTYPISHRRVFYIQ